MTAASPSIIKPDVAEDYSGPDNLVAETANLSLDGDIDPFCPNVHQTLLASLKVPIYKRHGFRRLLGKLPQVASQRRLKIYIK